MEKEATIVADTYFRQKEKLLQSEEKTDTIRKKLRQMQTNNYCAGQPVPDDVLRLQHEASLFDGVSVNADPSRAANTHPSSGS